MPLICSTCFGRLFLLLLNILFNIHSIFLYAKKSEFKEIQYAHRKENTTQEEKEGECARDHLAKQIHPV